MVLNMKYNKCKECKYTAFGVQESDHTIILECVKCGCQTRISKTRSDI